jgi:predicted flap endonuclease-1-like 5' DNA nuclease
MLHRNKTVVGARAMTPSFLPEIPKIDPEKGPNLLAGAASPLWLVFGGAAVAGATWWWWTARWREAVNVEALLAPAPAPEPAPTAVVASVTEAPALAVAPVEVVEPAPVKAAEPAPVKAAAEVAEKAVETVETVAAKTVETVKAAAEPVVEAAVEVAETAADDLTLLVGVGPKLAASLADLGVTRFSQIAGWSAEDLARFDKQLNLRGRADRDAWVSQARRLAAG